MSRVLDRAFEHPMKAEEEAAAPFAGGLMQYGYQCGMIWGATLAAGAQVYRLYGSSPEAEAGAVLAAQRIVESFRTGNKHINCLEITDLDKSSSAMRMIVYFLIKGGAIGCFRRAAQYAPIAFEEINAALSDEPAGVTSRPVSCAAMVAQRMGASEMHTVMAAGFAGGIGLCGGACGALGAAIWILGMNGSKDQGGEKGIKNPGVPEVIDKFIKSTDCKFECSEIVGRKFENIEDHAAHLRNGGCSKIIDIMAAV